MSRHIFLIAAILLTVLSSDSIASSTHGEGPVAPEMKARIKISGGGTYDYFILGMRADARDGFDNAYDTFRPGSNLNASYISTFFSHPEWHALKSEFRADIRAPKEKEAWTLSVYTNLPAGTALTMTLLEDSAIPSSCTLTVKDYNLGGLVNILDGPHDFSVPANKQLMHFKIVSECR